MPGVWHKPSNRLHLAGAVWGKRGGLGVGREESASAAEPIPASRGGSGGGGDVAAALAGLGCGKLHKLLEGQGPELGSVSDSSIQRILSRRGLVREQDRHPAALRRFERAAPNELWQMDFKGPKGFAGGKGPLSVIDDHSRYVLAPRHLDNGRVEAVQECLRQAFESSGLPDAMLMDHGTPWWNANSPWGWTALTVGLMRQGIRIYLSGIRHPQTQGKVERMHEALHAAIRKRKADADQQSWLDEFREEYNTLRPHEALAMTTPACFWKPSPRAWDAEPSEWEYPAPMKVMRLNHKGELQWQGRRWTISAALRGQLVGIDLIAERALVYFCKTPLRELDPGSANSAILPTHPLGAPASAPFQGEDRISLRQQGI